MIERLGGALDRLVLAILSAGFAALIVTVGLQVLARNVLKIPLIWTLDVAQLLFTWLIFVGAAVAFRRGAHYFIDLVPDDRPRVSRALDFVSDAAALVIVVVLLRYGIMLTGMRSTGVIASLGISEAWSYAAIPTGAALIGLFLLEKVARDLTKGRR
ncbi:MAG: hypothetical protein AcusKO_05860 [Acuticoccus sp.]